MPDYSEVYYRIFLNRDEKLTLVEMQDFDEYDYDQKRFYRENGEKVRFENEEDAISFLNERFKREFIDPEYLTPNHPDFSKYLQENE